jgi:hypothetical protein
MSDPNKLLEVFFSYLSRFHFTEADLDYSSITRHADRSGIQEQEFLI